MVSDTLSPFAAELDSADENPMILPPRFSIAASWLSLVRVDVYKRQVFPMHFWGNYGIFDRLALEKNVGEYADKIHRIEKEGQVFELEKGGQVL